METLETLLQQLEQDPELLAIKQQLSTLEAKMQAQVPEETWLLVLEWEAFWAGYLTLSLERLYPLAFQAGVHAGEM